MNIPHTPILNVRRSAALLGRTLAPQKLSVALLALFLLASIGLQLLVPQLLRRFIDTATGATPATASGAAAAVEIVGAVPLSTLALLFLLVALGTQLLSGAATVLGAAVGWRATNMLRSDLFAHTLALDMSFQASRTGGEMIERIDGDVTALADFFAQFFVRVFGGLLLLMGILVVLWFEHPLLGLALTLFTLLEVTVMVRLREVAVPATTREREATAQVFGFIEERLAGIHDIRANGGGAHALYRFIGVMREFFEATRRAWLKRSVVWLSTYALFVLGMLVTIGSSIPLVMTGAITLGTAYMVFQYLLMLQVPIEQINQQLQVFQRAGASVGRIDELWSQGSRLKTLESAGTLPVGPDSSVAVPVGPWSVAFEGVSFRYHDADSQADPNLRDVSFVLPAGAQLGLLGRTGSGKTTLTRLLVRFYDPDQGVVRLGGVDSSQLKLSDLRRRIALVTQEVQFFAGSVRDNLTFFDAEVDDARVWSALEAVGMAEVVRQLPQGLDTPLRASGGGVSAGEAQLLALARVFLDDPALVVLDEPSSRLDPDTEARLSQALTRVLAGRTAVIIAHRLETVERVDAIAVMAHGVLVEFGSRAQLAADPDSHYGRLLRAASEPGGSSAALEELA